MLNLCGKNMENQRLNQLITCASLNTISFMNNSDDFMTMYKLPFLLNVITRISSTFSTLENQKTYLLNNSFTHNPQYLLIETRKEN